MRRVAVHRGFKPDFRDLSTKLINDIALLKFDKPLDPDPGFGIMPICLSSSSLFKDEEKEGQFSSLRAESARAVTGRRCPHSGEGEDFLTRQPGFFFRCFFY